MEGRFQCFFHGLIVFVAHLRVMEKWQPHQARAIVRLFNFQEDGNLAVCLDNL